MRSSKVDLLAGDAMRAELTKVRAENDALRTCLLVLAKRDGRIRVTKRELETIGVADAVDVAVDDAGNTTVTWRPA